MARPSRARELSLWMNGQRVGAWRIPARGNMELVYDAVWLHAPEGRPLSLSLPLPVTDVPLRGPAVAAYFDNLLPDSDAIRKRLASRFRTDSVDAFDLLAAIGRDCVGALQLLGADETPTRLQSIDGTPLNPDEIEHLLASNGAPGGQVPRDADEDLRISLAGAQEKTALLLHEGRWLRPTGATPTTHIFKLPLGLVGNRRADFQTSVENEWLCTRILAAYGLPVPLCGMWRHGRQKALVVERFDRQLHASGSWWLRLPQEDFCQVFGVPSHAKYEADGGPGMAAISKVLANSINARHDLEVFFQAQILFWLLAAVDGHAKNFSIHLLAGGRYRLTPLYDVMSAWPVIGNGPDQFNWRQARLAMAVQGKNRHYGLNDIQRRHFNAMARRCGIGDNAEPLIERILARTAQALVQVESEIPAGFPGQVAERILGGLKTSLRRLETMPVN